jgi:hypothetical protein
MLGASVRLGLVPTIGDHASSVTGGGCASCLTGDRRAVKSSTGRSPKITLRARRVGERGAAAPAELGSDYPTQVVAGLTEHEKRVMAVRLNAARRQLTDAQKVVLGQQIEGDIAEIAQQKQVQAGQQYGRGIASAQMNTSCRTLRRT